MLVGLPGSCQWWIPAVGQEQKFADVCYGATILSLGDRRSRSPRLRQGQEFITDLVMDKIKGKKASEPDMIFDELMKSNALKATTGNGLEMFVEFAVEHAKP